MANRRMLNKSISISIQVNQLCLPARLIFTWMIAHADDEGRLKGDPAYIKAVVVPMTNLSCDKIKKYLNDMKHVGLIYYWEQNNEWFIEFIKWNDHQRIRKDRFEPSRLPSFINRDDNQLATKGKPIDNQKETENSIVQSSLNEFSDSEGKASGQKFSSIKDITETEFEQLANDYNVPVNFVASKYEDLQNYCASKGRVYKNYLAALRNFVKDDAIKIRKEAALHESKRGIDLSHLK